MICSGRLLHENTQVRQQPVRDPMHRKSAVVQHFLTQEGCRGGGRVCLHHLNIVFLQAGSQGRDHRVTVNKGMTETTSMPPTYGFLAGDKSKLS